MTRPRIFVNAVAARHGGGPNHLTPFLFSLADDLDDAVLDVAVTADFPYVKQHERINWLVRSIPEGVSPRRLYWDLVQVPRLADEYDLVLSPLNFGPLRCPRPHVVMQRNTLYFDPMAQRAERPDSRVKLAAFRRLAIAVSNSADHVFVPSESMRQMITPHLHADTAVEVAHHGIDVAAVCRYARSPLPVAAEAWATAPVRLLHVGHPSPHKNYRSLALQLRHVIDLLDEPGVALAVTASASPDNPALAELIHTAEACGVAANVHYLGPVPQPDVFSLYGNADVVLFPSFTESFGFPLLEAFASGVSVVGSDIPAFREIGGGLALLHEPDDAEGAARLVVAALGRDAAARDALRAHAATFDIRAQTSLVARRVRELIGA